LLKLMVPTEQALSALLYAAVASDPVLRLLTPIAKYRACRDNVSVATGAMEARGGNGYIEDWPNARLVRDAHLGLIWEGTSNINALDAILRAVGKARAHLALRQSLAERLERSHALPDSFRVRLDDAIADACRFAEQAASRPEHERFCRIAAGKLYHATTAALLASEGLQLGLSGSDARRLLLARFVLDHRLQRADDMAFEAQRWEDEAAELLIADAPVTLAKAGALLAS
jgi:acyl-CoA dehydrogenase